MSGTRTKVSGLTPLRCYDNDISASLGGRLQLAGASAVLLLVASGCSDPMGPRPGVAVSPEWVTGAAAAALDANSHFIFAPIPTGPEEVTRDQAVLLAGAFYATVAKSVGGLIVSLEEQHGGPIDLAGLKPCDRVIPISAPFRSPSDVLLPELQWIRESMAAKYAFEFCQGDGFKAVGLELSVATKVTVGPDGLLRFPGPPIIRGNDFFSFGIPLRPDIPPREGVFRYGLWALTAEAAVQAVYNLLHTPIRSVPEATGCLYGIDPCGQYGARLWRMETAAPVAIRRQGAAENELTQVFYVQVGLGANTPGGVYVAAPVQPAGAYVVYDFVRDQQPVTDSVLLTLSAPLAMESFTLAPAP